MSSDELEATFDVIGELAAPGLRVVKVYRDRCDEDEFAMLLSEGLRRSYWVYWRDDAASDSATVTVGDALLKRVARRRTAQVVSL